MLLFHANGFSVESVLYYTQYSVMGLLTRNPYPHAINGSLWSLPFEVSCYIGVAVLAALGVFRRAKWIVPSLFGVLWALYAFDGINPDLFRSYFPSRGLRLLIMLCVFFFAGCSYFLYRERIPHSRPLFIAAVGASAASLPLGVFEVVAPIAMTYAFLWLAFSLRWGWFESRGDFSYGTYIYAFPLQQGLALLRIHEAGFAAYFLSSVLMTLVLAFFSYRLIEKPALRFKSVQMPSLLPREKSPAACLDTNPVAAAPVRADVAA